MAPSLGTRYILMTDSQKLYVDKRQLQTIMQSYKFSNVCSNAVTQLTRSSQKVLTSHN